MTGSALQSLDVVSGVFFSERKVKERGSLRERGCAIAPEPRLADDGKRSSDADVVLLKR